jgi:integrating conjugative element protein (TIGR03749 family)
MKNQKYFSRTGATCVAAALALALGFVPALAQARHSARHSETALEASANQELDAPRPVGDVKLAPLPARAPLAPLQRANLSAPQDSTGSGGTETMVYDRHPLSITLHVGQERILFVDQTVRVGVLSNIQNRLRIQSADGAVYLTATAPFSPAELQLQNPATGHIMLVDVQTAPGSGHLPDVRILDGRTLAANAQSEQAAIAKASHGSVNIPAPVALTRYCAQMMYAPLRTVEPVPGLYQSPVRVMGKLRLFPTLDIEGQALTAYKLGSYTVTCVKLVNKGKKVIPLDARQLSGNFYSATFQHPWLGAAGTPEDTTVVYLVTRNASLKESLLPSAFIGANSPTQKAARARRDDGDAGVVPPVEDRVVTTEGGLQ